MASSSCLKEKTLAYTDRCLQGRERYHAFMAIVLLYLAAEEVSTLHPPDSETLSPLPREGLQLWILQYVGLLNT